VAAGDGQGVHFDLERGRFAGGEARGTFAVGIRRPFPAVLDVTLDGGTLDAVLARFQVPVRGFAGAVSGSLRYEFEIQSAERGRGRGDFEIAAVTPAGPDAVTGIAASPGGTAALPYDPQGRVASTGQERRSPTMVKSPSLCKSDSR